MLLSLVRSRRLALGAGLGIAALVATAPGARAPQGAAAATPIGFEVPSVVDPIHTAGEPDIGVNVQGRVFVSGPTGTGTQRSVWFGSVDGGHTYRVISAAVPSALQTLTNGTAPPGGGDTDIAFDHTGKQYFADLYALACLRVAITDPNGTSPQQNVFPGGCAGFPGADRQWFAVYDPPAGTPRTYTGSLPLVYMEYNNLQTLQTWPSTWTKSTDGLTFTAANGINGNFGADGYPAVDQATGQVFEAGLDGGDTGTRMLLNVGTIQADGSLKFLDDGAAAGDTSKLIPVATVDSPVTEAEFPVLSMDSAENLFAVWVQKSKDLTKHQTFLAVAPKSSGWKTWTVQQVSSAPSALSVFPWVKAGGPGRADVVWYGSDRAVDPSTDSGQSWNVFMNQVVFPVDATGAVTGTPPSQAQTKATPHPMHYGSICLIGTNCITIQGNRNLADFFNLTIDNTGAAEIVYDDTSNGLAQVGFTPGNVQLVDHAGAPVITVLRQSSGPGLFGTDVSGPSNTPVTQLSDPSGDALFPVLGGTNVAGMDIVSSSVRLVGSTLTVTMQVVDLSNPSATAQTLGVPFLDYVTRWQMGNTIYYAAAETNAAGQSTYAAGAAVSTDLCSVSACDPHVIDYPQAPVGTSEQGSISCPATPSAASPCTLTITVPAADVGNPGASSLLEEVGAYSLAATVPSVALVPPGPGNALALADSVPLEIDGVCCYNVAAAASGPSPSPTSAPTAAPTPTPPQGFVPLPSPPAGVTLPNTGRNAGVGPAGLLVLALAAGGGLAAVGHRRRRRRA